LAALLGLVSAVVPGARVAAVDSVDEIHYSYGDSGDAVTVAWRGDESAISYGLTDSYGFQAVAETSAITPVDRPGPFREVHLTGLLPDTAYHYRIGATGADHVLRTAPSGSFRWVDVGDTASTLCKPWVGQVHQLIAQLGPRFVTHGGDISEANACGVAAVHAYYMDQQVWSTGAAFQPAWGNHEYGHPTAAAPPGTPRDSLANYKGRGRVTHGHTLPVDSATKISPPGCPGSGGVNVCQGEDWGWFRAGGVLFINYPEIWTNALADWQPTAASLMAQAQADPTIDFIVTYGHRPAYASLTANGWDPTVRSALETLATRFSPRADNPDGKYVLNLGHHVHALEVFAPINGLTHITNATGGQGQVTFATPDPRSLVRMTHPGVLAGDYDAAARQLTLRWVCGPVYTPSPKDTCGYGDTVYRTTFSAYGTAIPTPDPGPTVSPSPTASPSPTVSPSDPDPSPSPSPTPTPTVTPTPTPTPTPTSTPTVTPTSISPSVGRQWVGNPGVERDLTGWAGRYGPSDKVTVARVTTDARSGQAAIKVSATAGADNLSSGFNDNPRWVTRTTAGTAFNASAWVRPALVGQEIVLRVREWTSAGALVTDRLATVRATSTGWQQVALRLTTARSGGSLAVAVYAKDLDAGEWFLTDDLSLTS
jgi:hypothetical protein